MDAVVCSFLSFFLKAESVRRCVLMMSRQPREGCLMTLVSGTVCVCVCEMAEREGARGAEKHLRLRITSHVARIVSCASRGIPAWLSPSNQNYIHPRTVNINLRSRISFSLLCSSNFPFANSATQHDN